MNISGKAGIPPPDTGRAGDSFSESMRREGAATMAPRFGSASSMSFRVGDLATGLSFMSFDFTPASGEGILDAIALGKGAIDEMQRYEEKTRYR